MHVHLCTYIFFQKSAKINFKENINLIAIQTNNTKNFYLFLFIPFIKEMSTG